MASMASRKPGISIMAHGRKIAVIGLGYVGLPVAVSFARSGVPVVGFDLDARRVAELKEGIDRTREVEGADLHQASLVLSANPAAMREPDFYIVTVPTPIDEARQPDLSAMIAASRSVGAVLKKGDIVVYESTVYPGAVEEDCVPILEQVSRLKAGVDFAIGYSPSGSIQATMPFQPGLVGGHCIGVDPYYLTYRAEKAGYHPEVILAGRRINDGMGQRVARECVRGLLRRKAQGGIVTILGLTFKEDLPDTRNSRVIDIIRELQSFGLTTQVHDPLANAADARQKYGVTLTELDALKPADAVILAVAHQPYVDGGWPLVQRLLRDGSGLVLDVKTKLDRASKPSVIELWRL